MLQCSTVILCFILQGIHEAQLLALQVKIYYGIQSALKFNLVRQFNNDPANFRYLDLIKEFENYKKRIAKDKTDAIKYANQELIRQILPFVDNLERSLQHADEVENFEALKEGIEMTLKDLFKTLERSGLETIPAKGKPFDPNVHEAIMQEERSDMAPNMVIRELQKGYKLHGRVLRPATVTVSKKKDS